MFVSVCLSVCVCVCLSRGDYPRVVTRVLVWGCPRSETESSLGDGIFFFYHHVRQRVRGGSYVPLSVQIFFFVCPRNYLNNIQDIIKVHFCQLRLVVSFNNILYTHARTAQASHHATLGRGAMGTYGVHDPSATVLSQAPNAFFSVSSLIKERKETFCCLFLFCSM